MSNEMQKNNADDLMSKNKKEKTKIAIDQGLGGAIGNKAA